MKPIFLWCVLIPQVVISDFCEADVPIHVMTFNIRFGTASDGENSWPLRREFVADVIRQHKPVVLGLQEALRDQLDEILQKFPQYAAVGVGREADGAGEYSPLIYDRTRFDVLSAETFWLSDTPTVRASNTWGNACTRICTWARLVDRTSNRVFCVYNTHWDHQSQPSRLKSGALLAEKVRGGSLGEPVIVMGDFNVGPLDPARKPLVAAELRDSFAVLFPDQARMGTFHAFTGKATSDKIDAILVSQPWQVIAAEIVKSEREGRFPSDHFPVTATLQLQSAD